MKIGSLAEVADQARMRFDRLAVAYQSDDAFPAPLPPGNGLRTLMEEAFWTSLSQDEGKPCRFTIAYFRDPGDAGITIALDRKPFERQTLRRLAGVAFGADAEIVVSSVGNELCVIGLHKYLREALDLSEHGRMPIEIEARGAGHIALRYAIFRVLTFTNGEIPEPGPSILDMPGPFRDALDKLAALGAIHRITVRRTLKSLLKGIDRNGHGGLFILSPAEPSGLESSSWPVVNDVYSIVDIERAQHDIRERVQLPQNDQRRISFSRAVGEEGCLYALERGVHALSAALALTDGGVWLDGSLRPRAFGVFAQLDPHRRIVLARDAAGTDRREMKFDMLGARHRAMVALAGHNPGCPAIAVSVDGGFSAALRLKDQEEVVVWRFQSWDIELDDAFDPQFQASLQEVLNEFSSRERKAP